MDKKASNALGILHVVPQLFPSLGPALLIAVGYIDPGKWAATVDGSARFGFDFALLALVLAFNCTAILCQYLAARVGVVTGKNLAQICREVYNRHTCIMLGLQVELSAIILELTMILGIAHGLNLLFGIDLFTCVFLTAIDAVLFSFFITLLDKFKTDMLFMSISVSVLFFYVLGVLISQPEIPVDVNGMFPRLRGESVYSFMSLLGASIMPQNFYLHSAIVQIACLFLTSVHAALQQQQKQQKQPNVSTGALCHDQFFAILFVLSGIFLVNYVLMLSAATVFHSAGLTVLTFQDSLLLMEQIFQSSIAPFAFFLVLFFSNQVTSFTWNLGGQVILHNFFGINPPVWIHRVTVKALAIIPALFCAFNSGAEGIYQLLIFSQLLLAMFLPSSVIPLFRVASSRSIMGAFKISQFMEILALSAFLGMLALNIIFIMEMLFGDSDWIDNLTWKLGSSVTLYYVLLLIACASIALTLWLAATPLKSATGRLDIQTWNWDVPRTMPELSEYREKNELPFNSVVRHDMNMEHMAEEADMEKSVASHSDNSVVECDHDLPETITESDSGPLQSAVSETDTMVSDSSSSVTELTSAAKLAPLATLDEVSASGSLDLASNVQINESRNTVCRTVGPDVPTVEKDDDETDVWELEESHVGISGRAPASMSDGPGSFRSVGGKNDDGVNGSGSLSRVCGLGRAARRQLAAILDEFWKQLYDFHGQVTQEAKAKRMDLVLGLESKSTSSVKADTAEMEYAAKYFSEAERRSLIAGNSRGYDSPRHQGIPSSLQSSFGIQTSPTSSSFSSYNRLLDAYAQSSGSNLVDASERRYSSLRLPSYTEDRDQQPARIHGCQIASYLSQIAADKNAGSFNSSSAFSTPKSTSLFPNYGDPLNYSLGLNTLNSLQTSSLQNATASAISRLQAERPYYDPSLDGTTGDAGYSACPKKYHSLPDISGFTVSNRNSSSNTRWNSPIGPGSSVGRMPYEQSSYSTTSLRAEGVPLAFDEVSPSSLYRDPFSLPASSSLDPESLWSRQPYEQLFGIAGKLQSGRHDRVMQETISPPDPEIRLLQSFRYCISRLLKLEGSDWLFRQSGGFDEELIDCVAATEPFQYEAEAREANRNFGSLPRNDEESLTKFLNSSVPHCGEGCIWRASLIISFGVWCIHRILELSLMESRPELWGKYTYVLNRLQGILDPAFFKLRPPISPCLCLQIPTNVKRSGPPLPNGFSPALGRLGRLQPTTANTLLDLIKDVEAAVSGRKGRTGTAAGDVAFPKGKENLASVLKRYKRRLSNKSVMTHEGGSSGSRKVHVPSVSFAL